MDRPHRNTVRALLIEAGRLEPTDATEDWWLSFPGKSTIVTVDVTPKGGVTTKKVFEFKDGKIKELDDDPADD